MGIECKSYTENAMLKHILVDSRLLKSLHPALVCCLLQLESMLGGSYSDPLANPQVGSPSTHTLMSHFLEVDLNIITLLEGERRVEQPIHQLEYFKELTLEMLKHVVDTAKRYFKDPRRFDQAVQETLDEDDTISPSPSCCSRPEAALQNNRTLSADVRTDAVR